MFVALDSEAEASHTSEPHEEIALTDRMRISPWDAAILEAARKAGCSLVLSEDLGAGQSYAGVWVENPF